MIDIIFLKLPSFLKRQFSRKGTTVLGCQLRKRNLFIQCFSVSRETRINGETISIFAFSEKLKGFFGWGDAIHLGRVLVLLFAKLFTNKPVWFKRAIFIQ